MKTRNAGVQDVLDTPIYSKVALSAAQNWRFFNGNDQDAEGNIDQPSVIDANSTYLVHYLDANFMKTDGSPIEDSDLALISAIVRNTWINFQLNSVSKAWIASMSSIVKAPLAVAAAGASAYNPVGIVNGSYRFNVPLIIPGGVNINVTLNRKNATDYTGMTLELALLGIVDRRIVSR